MNFEKVSFCRSFLRGMASIGDGAALIFSWGISSAFRTYEETFGSDTELIASDWQAVGDDLRAAMRRMDKELKTKGGANADRR